MSKQERAKVIAVLDKAQLAAKAYDEARTKFDDAQRIANTPGHKSNEAELKNLENLKAQSKAAREASVGADIRLDAAVSVTINRSSCTTQGKCDFSSAQKAAAKLDADVRNELQVAKLTKDEVSDRQLTLRTKLNSVLSSLAYDSLNSVKQQDRAKLLREVASWAATKEDFPAATTPFGHLKPILVKLLKAGSASDKALIHDLLAACQKQGMDITDAQRAEVGLTPSSP